MKIDEAIDDLYTILGQHNGEYMDYASYEAAVDNLNIISNFVAGTRWIPVSERLPTEDDSDENGYVWVWNKNGRGTWNWRDVVFHNHIVKITHWMPFPEPPKEVE